MCLESLVEYLNTSNVINKLWKQHTQNMEMKI